MAKEFVERLLKKLFGEKEDHTAEEMAPIKEPLVRSEKHKRLMRDWLASPRSETLLKSLLSEYENSINSPENGLIQLHRSPQANGFFFDKRAGVETTEFKYLLDHFREVMLDEGYTLYTSDKKYQEKSDSVQVVERHYLKPSISKEIELPLEQKYGNVLMEYVAYNDEPAYLKVMATCYSDRNYTEPKSFEELVSKLFSVKN